ncbi:hypothetical protein DDV21_008680 [Streptococcus chenjunshii]|uniref:Uncharacterized protein n=2 Tax=Streptococcus chenjunshii TaxID=2173853 RepID=A0A372KP76_9STRE|nr:hypothetical protein DDV21_008680 [Streptococcus chenjunshii]RFU50986.1 hypothetical protein DDV22_05825 [Streptococcus chenjunshii]RFU53378.1 hypothetical protein DDV23_04965 [Streptococcus chenjunshii]
MNQEEWLDYFRTVYGREPSAAEIQTALQNGDFMQAAADQDGVETPPQPAASQPETAVPQQPVNQPAEPVPSQSVAAQPMPSVQPPAKKKLKASTIIAISVVSGLILLFSILGGYAAYRYYSGKIDGVWELTYERYYDEEEEKWHTVLEEENNIEYHFFVSIENSDFSQYGYYYNKWHDGDYAEADIYLTNLFNPRYKVNPWEKTLLRASNPEAYKKKVDEVMDNFSAYYSGFDEDTVEDLKKSYIDWYNDMGEYQYKYKKSGTTLTIETYNEKGKLIDEMVFKRLSSNEAKKMVSDYEKIEENFRKKYSQYNEY